MNWKIVSDSSSNVMEAEDIAYCTVPLKIITEQKEYVDNTALNVREMVEYLQQYKGKSGSSCPNAQEWMDAFDCAEAVIGLTISGNLSGSYAAACQAREDYVKEHPDAKVFILDTLSTGPEMQLIIEKLKELIKSGLSFEKVRDQIKEYCKHTHLLFALQSLRNLANNGRVKPAVAAISGALGIRLIGKASDQGTLQPLHKCRGEASTLRTIIKQMIEDGWKGGKVRIAHCFNQSAASLLAEMMRKEHKSCQIEIIPCAALCSFYAEKGGLLVGFESL
ncbi:MAG: DegV family protein [Oscillospiraceae bacterium]|nr:DegV family protein [Oscillospiraceae bacterium]